MPSVADPQEKSASKYELYLIIQWNTFYYRNTAYHPYKSNVTVQIIQRSKKTCYSKENVSHVTINSSCSCFVYIYNQISLSKM